MGRKGQRRQDYSPAEVIAQVRATKAIDFRMAGFTFGEIGANLGISTEGARRALIRGLADLREHRQEVGSEVLELELERLDRLQIKPYTEAIRTGDAESGKAVLNIMHARAKYLGLYEPRKWDQDADLTVADLKALDCELMELFKELSEKAANDEWGETSPGFTGG